MKRYLNIFIFMFIFSLYFMTFLMIYDNFRERKINSKEDVALELFENKIEKNKKNTEENQNSNTNTNYAINYNNYTILGRIEIPKVGINALILKDLTYSAMNLGAVKSYGVDLNEKGGFVLSAHNFRGSSVFFYYVCNLKKGDPIRITDSSGRVMVYKVYSVSRYVSPDDTSYFKSTDDYHLTIVTCESGGKSRIIVKARA